MLQMVSTFMGRNREGRAGLTVPRHGVKRDCRDVGRILVFLPLTEHAVSSGQQAGRECLAGQSGLVGGTCEPYADKQHLGDLAHQGTTDKNQEGGHVPYRARKVGP